MADGGFATTVEEIAAQLEQHPVLVEEIMGNGNTEALRDALSQKAAQSPVPVHVVLTKAPRQLTTDNTAEELLSLLHAETGKDGVWVVSTPDVGHTDIAVYGNVAGVAEPELHLSSAVSQAMGEVRKETFDTCDCFTTPAVEAGLVLDVLAEGIPEEYGENPITDDQVESYLTSTWYQHDTQTAVYDRAEMPTPGLNAMLATVVVMVVAVVSYRLVQAVGGAPAARPGKSADRPAVPAPDPEVELQRWRKRAATEVSRLGTTLERAAADAPRRDVASACHERAEPRVDSDDLLEVVGALVLARTGRHALRTTTGQYVCCYVDPRHNEADTEAPLGGGLRVPVCRKCAVAIERGSGLAPLSEETRFGRHRAYYEGRSVWANSGFGALGGEWWLRIPLTPGGRR